MAVALAVHGGAWAIPDEELEAHRAGCARALEAGLAVLDAGGTSLDAVEAAVASLEDDGAFDAGRGSFLDARGEVVLDAGIMDGRLLRTGSVAAVRGVRNPVRLARRVLESPLAVLVGEGAELFAREHGVELCDPAELVHERERRRFEALRSDPARLAEVFGDTVGAVALDAAGDLAAATSTGGSPLKPLGRVGDSPFVGAGLYADNEAAAASATGDGERIIPLVWSKAAADLARERGAPAAARDALRLLDRVGGRAGLILLDPQGRVGVAWNTPRMAYAYRDASGRTVVF